METTIIILTFLTLVSLALLFIQWKQYKRLKKVVIFLRNVGDCNEEISSTRFLASLGIKNLNNFGHKLVPFFQSMFAMTIISHSPIMINKIGQYIHRLKKLKDSPEKDYLIKIFKKSIFQSEVNSFAFIVYQSIKIKHQNRDTDGKTVENFLFTDINNYAPYMRDLDLVIHKINFYEKNEPATEPETKALIRENLDEVILKLNKLITK